MDKRLAVLLTVFFVMFVAFVTALYLGNTNQLVTFTRAKEDYLPSAKASLLFGYPLMVKADGKTKSTINIFIRSDKGMPVKSQNLIITSSLGELSDSAVTTDDQGKASVSLTSTTSGTASVEVLIGGSSKIAQSLSIKFN